MKTRPKSPGASSPRGDGYRGGSTIKSPRRVNEAKSPLRKAESPGRSKSPQGGRPKSPAHEYPAPLQEVRELLDSTMQARRLDTSVLSGEISRLEMELRAVHEARARDAVAQEAETQALLAQLASSLATAETERRRLEAEATTARLQLGKAEAEATTARLQLGKAEAEATTARLQLVQAEEAARAKLDAMEKTLEREAMAEALMAREVAGRRAERAGYPPNRHAQRVSASSFFQQRRPARAAMRRDSTLMYLPNGGKFAIVEVRAAHYEHEPQHDEPHYMNEPHYEPARTVARSPPPNPPRHAAHNAAHDHRAHHSAAHDLPNIHMRAPSVWNGAAFFDTRDRTWVEMQLAGKLP